MSSHDNFVVVEKSIESAAEKADGESVTETIDGTIMTPPSSPSTEPESLEQPPNTLLSHELLGTSERTDQTLQSHDEGNEKKESTALMGGVGDKEGPAASNTHEVKKTIPEVKELATKVCPLVYDPQAIADLDDFEEKLLKAKMFCDIKMEELKTKNKRIKSAQNDNNGFDYPRLAPAIIEKSIQHLRDENDRLKILVSQSRDIISEAIRHLQAGEANLKKDCTRRGSLSNNIYGSLLEIWEVLIGFAGLTLLLFIAFQCGKSLRVDVEPLQPKGLEDLIKEWFNGYK